MRESVGTTWIFQIVLTLILIFAAYLALTINYSRAFLVKNESLTIIEKHEGLTDAALEIVNNYLQSNGYHEVGKCPSGWKGIESIYSNTIEEAEEGKKYAWCATKISNYNTNAPNRSYYKIRMFFKFDLPVFGHIMTYNVDGKTYEMNKTYDSIF